MKRSNRPRIYLKSDDEIAVMRRAGKLTADTLRILRDAVRPGITTAELDRIAEEYIRSHGGVPSFKGYQGYPATACISVNEQIVHGIPGERRLEEGDIVSIDMGAIVDGFQGDSAITLPVGVVSEEAKQLMLHTYRSLFFGIEQALEGNRLGDISHAIQVYAESHGYSVVRELVGHGIGRSMHEEPQIPNYGPAGHGPILKKGMTLAIEPMINIGTPDIVVAPDQWTVSTRDGKLSAHFEHTVAIGDEGPEILTRWPANEEPI
ncbi:MAG TPA: type I methionyl aminopeptidase [Armatimonadota bacterium]|nr:type I methionyl aminopeptidase [Armatimonadota bacterium]